MRPITAAIVAVLLTLFLPVAQAKTAACLPPPEMHDLLIKNGFFLFTYGTSDDNFLIATYIGRDRFAVVAESDSIACVLTEGNILYMTMEGGA